MDLVAGLTNTKDQCRVNVSQQMELELTWSDEGSSSPLMPGPRGLARVCGVLPGSGLLVFSNELVSWDLGKGLGF